MICKDLFNLAALWLYDLQGTFHPRPCCDSVILCLCTLLAHCCPMQEGRAGVALSNAVQLELSPGLLLALDPLARRCGEKSHRAAGRAEPRCSC